MVKRKYKLKNLLETVHMDLLPLSGKRKRQSYNSLWLDMPTSQGSFVPTWPVSIHLAERCARSPLHGRGGKKQRVRQQCLYFFQVISNVTPIFRVRCLYTFSLEKHHFLFKKFLGNPCPEIHCFYFICCYKILSTFNCFYHFNGVLMLSF